MPAETLQPYLTKMDQQIRELLDTGEVQVNGSKYRRLLEHCCEFKPWGDLPILNSFNFSWPDVRDEFTIEPSRFLDVYLTQQIPGDIVQYQKFLWIFGRKIIVPSTGFSTIRVTASCDTKPVIRDIKRNFHKPSRSYQLLLPRSGNPSLTVQEDEIMGSTYLGTRQFRKEITLPTLKAFSTFLDSISR